MNIYRWLILALMVAVYAEGGAVHRVDHNNKERMINKLVKILEKRSCHPDEFQCGDGHCIEITKNCDGTKDCQDASDESNCLQPVGHVKRGSCPVDEEHCPGSDVCVPEWWLCDGEDDCSGGTDENLAFCSAYTCPESLNACQDGSKCILREWLCDGEADCLDQSDEYAGVCDKCENGGYLCREMLSMKLKNYQQSKMPEKQIASMNVMGREIASMDMAITSIMKTIAELQAKLDELNGNN